MDVRLVCFDLGGVVIRICRSWAEGCAAAGLQKPALAAPPEMHAAILRYESGLSDTATYAREVSAALGAAYSPDEVLAVHRAWLREPYEGVDEIVDGLHATGCATAVLSNTNPEHWRIMQELAVVKRVRHAFVSHLIGAMKPDAAAFSAVEAGAGCRGSEILFFDDTPVNIEAARARGWQAVAVDHRMPTAAQIRSALAGLLG